MNIKNYLKVKTSGDKREKPTFNLERETLRWERGCLSIQLHHPLILLLILPFVAELGAGFFVSLPFMGSIFRKKNRCSWVGHSISNWEMLSIFKCFIEEVWEEGFVLEVEYMTWMTQCLIMFLLKNNEN